MAAKSDGAKSCGHDPGEDSRLDGAAKIFVNIREEAGERRCVVAGERPPCTSDGEEGSDQTRAQGQEDDEQKSECSCSAAGRLNVNFGKRKRAATIEDCIEIGNSVKERNSKEESDC